MTRGCIGAEERRGLARTAVAVQDANRRASGLTLRQEKDGKVTRYFDELNEDAIKASFVGPPPTDVPIYVFSEQMTLEQWLASHRKYEEDPTWSKTHGGTPIIAFPSLHSAKRIHVADRPVKC